MNKNCPEILELRLRIEKSINRKVKTPTDFDFLCGSIWERTHENISSSTLKRLWGYIDGVDNTRYSTLNLLSKFLGYQDWDEFIKDIHEEEYLNSDLILNNFIASSSLKKGNILKIGWQPNRLCRIEYLGNQKYEVKESENSKLKIGDTFECSLFILGEPVYINELRQNHGISEPSLFVVGNKSGLTILEIEK